MPRPGDVLLLDGRASVQFADDRALVLRVTSVSERATYYGWCWLTGYALDRAGAAVERREVFVQLAGLRPVPPKPRHTAGRAVSTRGRGV
ncbi:hypothetical protein O7626_25840 [Micromonospora sp. WMMD1102]|uniref:hypothetical protein n=1 Tax=Micromonospora sp. WMMD1102 TaxID=3016105 RepID=UPI002415546A|nr:hypothetical protein [Micromonospora sp. WMMD1102]MDG4789306.1 hypothetical protein [Micromonospora sp. WMMD1102]